MPKIKKKNPNNASREVSKSTKDGRRFRRFANRLRTMVERYRDEYPSEYERMVRSVNLETDVHVLQMLRQYGMLTPVFESTVLFAARYMWTKAMQKMAPYLPDSGMQSLVHFGRLLEEIRSRNRADLTYFFGVVWTMKRIYLQHHRHRIEGECAVLICHRKADGLLMNSLRYCRQHSGLAVLNGLRHATANFCSACRLWKLVRLKTTMNDRNHQLYAAQALVLPTVHRSVGNLNLRIQRFASAGFHNANAWGYTKFQLNSSVKAPALYQRTSTDAPRMVPRNAWYVPDDRRRDGNWAVAWILLVHKGLVNRRKKRTITKGALFEETMARLELEHGSMFPPPSAPGGNDGWGEPFDNGW